MVISSEEEKQALFLKIAKEHFDMDSLETIGLEIFGKESIKRWAVKAALLHAFNAGVMSGIKMIRDAKNAKKKR